MQLAWQAGLAVLISSIICAPGSLGNAQKKIPAAEYDYYALAITSITEITGEASKLPDVPQRAKILIQAAKVYTPQEKKNQFDCLNLSCVI